MICPDCHVGYMLVHSKRGWLKCSICGFCKKEEKLSTIHPFPEAEVSYPPEIIDDADKARKLLDQKKESKND